MYGHAKDTRVRLVLTALMKDTNCAVPAIAGLGIGVAFIILLASSVSVDLVPEGRGQADNATDEDEVLLGMIQQSSRHESIQLLRTKYTPVDSDVYQFVEYGTEWKAFIVYTGGPKVRVDYPDMPVASILGHSPNSLISYHSPSIWMTFDREGNMTEIELRSSVTFHASERHYRGIISKDSASIMEILGSERC